MFEKNDENLVIVATLSVTPTQATSHNVTVLDEKLVEKESENIKVKDDVMIL